MTGQKTDSSSLNDAAERANADEATATERDAPETGIDVGDLSGNGSSDEEPRSASLSSLLRRLEDSDDPAAGKQRQPQAEGSQDEAVSPELSAKVSSQLSEMNDLLLRSETGDDPIVDEEERERSRRETAPAAEQKKKSPLDEYWGADGFERDDDSEIRADSELMSLINELNGKLDRAHDAIARSLPPEKTEPARFEPPPEVLERKLLPQPGRIREALMFTGMWGALLAAVIAVVYSNSSWFSESTTGPELVSANNAELASSDPQSRNRLGALGGAALSERDAPKTSPSGSLELAGTDAANEPRRPPRPATPDVPATSGDSATDVISRALTAPDIDPPEDETEGEAVAAESDAAPAGEENSPVVVRVTAPTPDAGRQADAATSQKEPQLTLQQEAERARTLSVVSEWQRVARATLGADLIRQAQNLDKADSDFSVGVVSGKAGQAVSLPISLPRVATNTEASIMISGLPEGSHLSAGEQAGLSTWILSASDTKDLMLLTPEDIGPTDLALEVTLVTSDGAVPNTKLVTVELAAADPKPKTETASVRPQTIEPSQSRAVAPTNPKQAEAAELLQRGRDLMQIGDIAGARLVLTLAAELESVDAMVTLAMTYDPVHLNKLRVRGIQPDIAKAIAWYRRASAQGDNESGERAEALVASLRQ